MAEDKKKPAAPPSPFTKNHFNETMIMLVVLLLLSLLFTRLRSYLINFDAGAADGFWDQVILWLLWLWYTWKGVAVVVIGICLVWFIYARRKLNVIAEAEEKIFGQEPEEVFLETGASIEKKNERWEKILAYTHSDSPADWRLAIIEADVMLDDLLKTSGYHGDGVGEMLKSVDPSDMLTLDAAWEAHKIRNRIAHSGTDFELTQREAKRIVTLFESVFKEAGII